MNVSKRHIVKTITWRTIASIDTLLISYYLTGNLITGIKISFFEIISKMILYYFHEQFWFKSKIKNPNRRHVVKTLTWRSVGTIDTIVISTFVVGNPFIGLKIGGIETISKIILYYLHEKFWYRINFGLIHRIKK